MREIKPKYVDGEPRCSGRKCWAYKVVHPQTGECGIELRYVVEHDVCIASLRQQRDQAIAERDELRTGLGCRNCQLFPPCNECPLTREQD